MNGTSCNYSIGWESERVGTDRHRDRFDGRIEYVVSTLSCQFIIESDNLIPERLGMLRGMPGLSGINPHTPTIKPRHDKF